MTERLMLSVRRIMGDTMLKKILCFLWGHKTVHKAYTGEQMSCVSMLELVTLPLCFIIPKPLFVRDVVKIIQKRRRYRMGMLSDKMNADFDRRIEIAKRLGLKVHGPKMMALQMMEKIKRVIISPLIIPKGGEKKK